LWTQRKRLLYECNWRHLKDKSKMKGEMNMKCPICKKRIRVKLGVHMQDEHCTQKSELLKWYYVTHRRFGSLPRSI